VNALTKTDIASFIAQNYNTHQAVFAVTGQYDFNKIIKLAERYFGELPENNQPKKRIAPGKIAADFVRVQKPISQTHCMMGSKAYASFSDKKVMLLLLNNLLGGNGMSSRLNLEIREKYGIAYTVESNYSPMTDTGLFSIYFGTDPEKAPKAIKLIQKELQKLRDNKLGTLQLHQAKQKFIGQIALGEENRLGLILSMAKSLMDFGRIDTLEEVFAKINAVSAEDLLEVSNEIFDPAGILTLLFEPES
ncbi:MAG: insulinase family protein, partial [Sphingobacteriaceae bacterium]